MEALVADVEGRRLIRRQISGQAQDAEALGVRLAEMLAEAARANCFPESEVQTPGPDPTASGEMGVSSARKRQPKAELRTAFRPSLKAGLRTMRRRKSRSWPSPRRAARSRDCQRRSGFGLTLESETIANPKRRRASPRYSDIASSSRGPPNRAVR